jgi:hypothetical protein
MTSNKQHWSYLAGLIDGEGHITISKGYRSKTNGKTHYWNYLLQIGIDNTNVKLMKWLLQYFGGVYYGRDRSEGGQRWKSAYEWRPKGMANKKLLLLGVLPYLVLKSEQAKIALSYLEIQGENPELRDAHYQQMTKLNQKGKSVETDTPNTSPDVKIQSELAGDGESAPVGTQETLEDHLNKLII